ncbi:MAG: hydrogenase expression/formation protein HypE [Myxococcota bacterium]
MRPKVITQAHGSGGRAMRDLIANLIVERFDNPVLRTLEDQARLRLDELAARGDRLAMTTDSYVVSPLFFPGSDIGALAVNGTVNDLAVSGATPLYLTCGLILEEGLELSVLERVLDSMAAAAKSAGVSIVTGDTKVVEHGSGDQIFINTAGIGVIPHGRDPAVRRVQAGDRVIVNGMLGDHGAAILLARGELSLEADIGSDCQPLNGLVEVIFGACSDVHAMRDVTRGGLATVLNEMADGGGVQIEIDEKALPVRDVVRGTCELLGLDPLYLANEGKLAVVVPGDAADAVVAAMRKHPAGREACVVAEVVSGRAGRVIMKTGFGGNRVVDTLVGDQLPRIC